METFSSLGFKKEGDDGRNVYILFLSDTNQDRVELIQPVDEQSPVYSLMARQGPGAYHLFFSVSVTERDSWLSRLKKLRFVPVGGISSAPACGDQDVGFFYSNKIGLIELLFISDR